MKESHSFYDSRADISIKTFVARINEIRKKMLKVNRAVGKPVCSQDSNSTFENGSKKKKIKYFYIRIKQLFPFRGDFEKKKTPPRTTKTSYNTRYYNVL